MRATPAPRDRGEARAAAVRQVLIARTREALCEACSHSPGVGAPLAVSARVEGADLFVITADVDDPRSVGPAETSVIRLDGGVAAAAWNSRATPSSAIRAHAALYRDAAVGAVASSAGAIVHAPAPALALSALADLIGGAPSPVTGIHPDAGGAPVADGTAGGPPHRRSTQ